MAVEYNAVKVLFKKQYGAIIILFEKFVVIEFPSRNDGPVYLITTSDYQNDISRLKELSRTDFKSELYSKYRDTENRIVHRTGWQTAVDIRIRNLLNNQG